MLYEIEMLGLSAENAEVGSAPFVGLSLGSIFDASREVLTE